MKPQGPLPVGGDRATRARMNCGVDEQGHTQTGPYITARRTALPGRAKGVGTHSVERCLPPPSLSLATFCLHCGEAVISLRVTPQSVRPSVQMTATESVCTQTSRSREGRGV